MFQPTKLRKQFVASTSRPRKINGEGDEVGMSKRQVTNAGMGVKEKEPLHIGVMNAIVGMQTCKAALEISLKLPQNTNQNKTRKQTYQMNQHSWAFVLRCLYFIIETFGHPCSLLLYSNS